MPLARLKVPRKVEVARVPLETRDRMLHRRMVSDRRVNKRELRELIEQREYELRAD